MLFATVGFEARFNRQVEKVGREVIQFRLALLHPAIESLDNPFDKYILFAMEKEAGR